MIGAILTLICTAILVVAVHQAHRRRKADPVRIAAVRQEALLHVYQSKRDLAKVALDDALRARLAWKQAVDDEETARKAWSDAYRETDGSTAQQRVEDLEREAEAFVESHAHDDDKSGSPYRGRA